MKEAGKPPLMLEFLFGEAAGVAQRSASPRLLRWSSAYDEWLAERKNNHDKSTYHRSISAWRRLLTKAGKPPWELARADIEEHCLFMKEAGYAPGTIAGELTTLRGFYRWCGERRIDRDLPAGFNPAAEMPFPKTGEYAAGRAMSPEEARALLAIYRREGSVFSLRDYALFRAQLELGGRFAGLLELRWGQIERDESGIWVWLGSRADQPAAAAHARREPGRRFCDYLRGRGAAGVNAGRSLPLRAHGAALSAGTDRHGRGLGR